MTPIECVEKPEKVNALSFNFVFQQVTIRVKYPFFDYQRHVAVSLVL